MRIKIIIQRKCSEKINWVKKIEINIKKMKKNVEKHKHDQKIKSKTLFT